MVKSHESRDEKAPALASSLQVIAFDAAVWGMPIVSMDAMRQAFLRDAQAQYNDVLYWSRPADWRLQLTTPNASAHYAYVNFNCERGPIVVEVPAARAAGLFGSILDAWQVPQVDVGPHGADQGKGARYLLLPPDYGGQPREGYVAVPLRTFNAYALLRAIPERANPDPAVALIRQLRIYPLIEADHPPPQRFIDMSGKLFDGLVRFDVGFFESLARMIDEEPAYARDAAMLRRIEALGIKKGAGFSRHRIKDVLTGAARDAQMWLISAAEHNGEPYWPSSTWLAINHVGARTQFTFEQDGELDVQARGQLFFLGCAPPAKLGRASSYLSSFTDAAGELLLHQRNYRLHVPPAVPATQFWALTVYNIETAGFVRGAASIERGSLTESLQRNLDGSVDLYIGRRAPQGKESNWIDSGSAKSWFAMFRFYGPEQALFDKSWLLPDLEQV